MKDVFARLTRILSSERIGKYIFAGAVAATVAAVAIPRGTFAVPPIVPGGKPTTTANNGSVDISASLSQTKIVQGADGTFYLEVAVQAPEIKAVDTSRAPVDLVVVLDRSGSMTAENRLPYAKSAIKELLSRLGNEDRFGLVTFDTGAEVVSPLTIVSSEFRERERAVVDALQPGGSTNLSGGLELAKTMLSSAGSGRTRKVVLMSDGEANVGIIDPRMLAELARSFSRTETVVSTIGMGLGFNEVLMSSLADHGMGNYSYLENLASLGDILRKDLTDSRAIYASSSGLEIKLPENFKLVDTSGYPQEPGASPGSVRLLTGQLFSGAKKTFFLTVNAPTAAVGSYPLGEMTFNYTAAGAPYTVKIDGSRLALAVVEPSRTEEALASVDANVLKKSWVMNNLGRIQRTVSDELRAGNAPAAQAALAGYRRDLAAAEKQYRMKLDSKDSALEADAMSVSIADVISSTGEAKKEKENRAAKVFQSKGLGAQRSK